MPSLTASQQLRLSEENRLRLSDIEPNLGEPHPAIACPGFFCPTRSNDGLLVRLRIPGGRLDVAQAIAVADFAEASGDGLVLVTNRANLQLRSRLERLSPEQLQHFQNLGLAAPIAAVDHLRNLMVSPTAGLDGQAMFDSWPIVQRINQYISSHPELAGLSAKFSVGIDAGEGVSVRHRSNDIWLVAENATELRVFFDQVDSGIGIGIAESVGLVAAIAQVYLHHAHQLPVKDSVHRRSAKPRLRDLIEHWGMEWFVDRVCAFCAVGLSIERNWSARPLNPPILGDFESVELADLELSSGSPQNWGAGGALQHLGTHRQNQSNQHYIGIIIPLGYLTHHQLRGLANIAQTYGNNELRLTPWQNIIISNINTNDIAKVENTLTELNLSYDPTNPAGSIVSCAGKSSCKAAETYAHQDAQTLLQKLTHLTFNHPINIHVSGCAKACAQPYASDIALMGVAENCYEIYLRDRQQPFGKRLYPAVKGAAAIAIVTKIIHIYQNQSQLETFTQFIQRFELAELRQLIAAAVIAAEVSHA